MESPSPDSSHFSESGLEQIAPGLTRSWLMDRRIVVFRATTPTRPVVDAWIACVKRTMQDWPASQPYLAIHDFSAPKVSLTPYARQRSEELIPLNTGRQGYAALILAPTYVAQVIRLFLHTQSRQGNENRVFFSMDKAIIWLDSRTTQLRTKD
jgi:hypothetical protein